MSLGSSAALQVGVWYNANMNPEGFVRFKVKYADATSSRVRLNFADYVTIRHRSTTKTMTVDQVFAVVKPSLPAGDPNPNSSPLIPLPPVAVPDSELGSR